MLKDFFCGASPGSEPACLSAIISSAWGFEPDQGDFQPGPEVIKLFSCSTQLSMKFYPLINVKMPTIVGILTLMSGKNSILGLPRRETSRIS